MKPKEAVAIAKQYIHETFEEDEISQLTLEEIDFDDTGSSWMITIGFLRPADRKQPALDRLLPKLSYEKPLERVYRVVRIRDTDGTVASVKIRDLAA